MRSRRLAPLAAVFLGIALVAAASTPRTLRPHPIGARWFSAKSPLNTPIASDARVDSASRAMIANLIAETKPTGWPISVKRWTVPVYYSDSSTPRQNVALTSYWAPARTLHDVPVPTNAQADPSSDGHMAIIDPDTGCFYEFYRAVHAPDGKLSAGWANRGLLTGKGIQPGAWSTRDSGFVNFAGLIRPEDLRAGVIKHALVFSTMYSLKGPHVAPATSSGGAPLPAPTGTKPIPYGAHLQLDPTLDLRTLGLAPWQKVVARALKVYGMYLADTGGFSIGAVNSLGYETNPYTTFWGDSDYAYLPASLVGHLRVLKLGPLRKARGFLVKKNRCGVEH
jgi:hypothetical protein